MLRALLLVAMVLGGSLKADEKEKDKPKLPPEKSEVPYESKTHGAIEVKGSTGDWFTIYQGEKKVGPNVPPKLGDDVKMEPGDYDVYVNRTKRTVTVKAGTKVVLETGTLIVEGKGANWWSPWEGKERRVADAPPKLNSPLALFPGTYSVQLRVGDKNVTLAEAAKVEPGQKTALSYTK
jgi:hypothetical protein